MRTRAIITQRSKHRGGNSALRRGVAVLWLLVAIASAWLIGPVSARAEPAAGSRAYQVKAAFITKFVPFIEWPADSFAKPVEPLVIAVVNEPSGRDPFDNALEQFAEGKTYNGRPLAVRHLQPDADLTGCHVLFIPASQDSKLAAILKSAEGRSILTVGESDAFPWAGGAVRFFIEDNKVRFEVSREALKSAKISASSKFLALGKQFSK